MRFSPLLALALLGGCIGQLHEFGPADMAGGGGGNDMAMMMGQVTFASDIQKDMDKLGCTASTCHGQMASNPMKLVPNATAMADLMANYQLVSAETSGGSSCKLLTKALGMAHGGGTIFQSTSDPTYVKWLGWVNAGAPSGLGGGSPDMAMGD